MRLKIAPLSLRLKSPLITARGPMHMRSGFAVTVFDSQFVGRGEAFPLADFGTESEGQCAEALKALAVVAPTSIADIESQLGLLRDRPTARFAVECALLEWLSKRQQCPVYGLFGLPFQTAIAVNALISGRTATDVTARAREAIAQGFQTLKLKVAAAALEEDTARLESLRAAFGDDVNIRVDANGAWTLAEAKVALARWLPFDLELCEQPVAAANVSDLAALSGVGCKIAADESLHTEAGRAAALNFQGAPAVQVLVLKPAVLGGLLPTLRLAAQAQSLGLKCYVTTLLDGPFSRAACAHVAAVLPGPLAHGLSTVELFEGIDEDACSPRDGRIQLGDRIGWGI
jgi:o-succinylbenzoate synthase